MEKLKKAGHFLSSMRFALLLLAVLIAACIAGSLIPQGRDYAYYARIYPAEAAGAIVALHLTDVFHSAWFVAIAAFLCLNLLLCSVVRLPALTCRWRALRDAEQTVRGVSELHKRAADPAGIFSKMGFAHVQSGETDGRAWKCAVRGSAGIFGAWICHLGILLVILGFGLGQVVKEEYTVYGVPGDARQVGETDCILSIDDFRIETREDGSVVQYTADLTMRDAARGLAESGTASVNAPAELLGMKLYQNSTGWAARVRIFEGGKELQDTVLCAGDFLPVKDKPELVVYLNALYPDYAMTAGGPVTMSEEVRNPAYLYSVYYQGQILGMNALPDGEELTIDEYTVTFSEPQHYTLIQVKRDPLAVFALLGGLVIAAGLLLALFIRPARMWAVRADDDMWDVYASSQKGGPLFAEAFEKT